ncbi:MAG: hypothetical protein V4493_01720, partial [Pseudomonadota bacterium]
SYGGGGGGSHAVNAASAAPAVNTGGSGNSGGGQQGGGTYRFEGLSSGSFVSSDMVVAMLKQAQKDGALRGQITFEA